jgi:hypothetical protein
MENYKTKTEAIIGLQSKGYDLDFILRSEYLFCIQDNELISPDDFEITGTYRFDDHVIVEHKNIVYAIRSLQSGIKGILITSYGAFTKGISIHLWSKLGANL